MPLPLPRRRVIACLAASALPAVHAASDAPAHTIDLVVKQGRPVGPVRAVRLAKGDAVVVTITADTKEEVHLHGYDLHAHPAPGKPATLRFTATRTGRFALELHGSDVQLCVLEVYPK